MEPTISFVPCVENGKSYTLTNAGLEITLPIFPYESDELCLLNCRERGESLSFCGLRLRRYGQHVDSKIYFVSTTNRLEFFGLGHGRGEVILYAKQQHITILDDGEYGSNDHEYKPQPALTVLCTYERSGFALIESSSHPEPHASLMHLELPTARGLYGIFVLRSSDLPDDSLLLAFFLISTQHCCNRHSINQIDEFAALPVLIPVHRRPFESTTLEVFCDYLCHSYRELRTTLLGVAPLATRALEARVSMINGPTLYARASFPQEHGEYFMHLEIGLRAQPVDPVPGTPVDYLYRVACRSQQRRYFREPIVAQKDTHEFHRATHLAYVANHVNSGDVRRKKGGRYTHALGNLCSCAGPDNYRSDRLAQMKATSREIYSVLKQKSAGPDIWSWPDDITIVEDKQIDEE